MPSFEARTMSNANGNQNANNIFNFPEQGFLYTAYLFSGVELAVHPIVILATICNTIVLLRVGFLIRKCSKNMYTSWSTLWQIFNFHLINAWNFIILILIIFYKPAIIFTIIPKNFDALKIEILKLYYNLLEHLQICDTT